MLEITYSYYQDTYGGTSISEENFAFIMRRTIGIANGALNVDLINFDPEKYTEADQNRLKIAICAAADVVNSATNGGSAVVSERVASESVSGAWSKSYVVSDKNTPAAVSLRQDAKAVLEDYLSGTDFILRGCWLCV